MHFGLIVHTQFAARDRLPQVGFEAEAFQGARVHFGVEHFILRRAGSLGAIHGHVGIAQEFIGLVVGERLIVMPMLVVTKLPAR
jgi:hypothetical protein